MIIPYNLPTNFGPESDPDENAKVLRNHVECLINDNLIFLEHHPGIPMLTDPRFGVRYARTNDWLNIPALWMRRFGDCKSLSAMRIAQIRFHKLGQRFGYPQKVPGRADPVFRYQANSRGGIDYHILVQTGTNEYQDPSKECGMNADEWSYFGPGGRTPEDTFGPPRNPPTDWVAPPGRVTNMPKRRG